jgi:hypothetical protein
MGNKWMLMGPGGYQREKMGKSTAKCVLIMFGAPWVNGGPQKKNPNCQKTHKLLKTVATDRDW